eukprot:403332433
MSQFQPLIQKNNFVRDSYNNSNKQSNPQLQLLLNNGMSSTTGLNKQLRNSHTANNTGKNHRNQSNNRDGSSSMRAKGDTEPSFQKRYYNQDEQKFEDSTMQQFQQQTVLPEIKSTNLTIPIDTMSPSSVRFQEMPNDNQLQNQRTLFGMSNSSLALNPSGMGSKFGRQNTTNTQKLSIEDVSPELAAQIVKNFILPMFDSDNKRYLRGGITSPKTVYGELKLSEQLNEQLNEVRNRFDDLQEQLEEVTYQRDLCQRELKELNTKYMQRGTAINNMNRQNALQKQVLKESIMKCVQLISSGNSLTSFAQISEHYRKHYAELLRDQLLINDQIKYQLQEVTSSKTLNEAKYEIIEEQLKFLYNSLQSLANAKNLEDKFQFKIDTLQLQYNSMMSEKSDMMDNLRRTTSERDESRDFLKEMTASRTMLLKEKEAFATSMKDKVAQLELDLKSTKSELDKLNEDFQKLEKFNKQMLNERDKMKQRLVKLKNRRFKIDQEQKICKKCGKEYHEKENYNWSCRTHQSDYGGEMWWCCGKTDKEAQGCKFSKHESKEDDEDDADPDDKLQDQLRQLKNVRCLCCKELGHRMELCPRDPNIRTAAEPEEDIERISRIKDFRRLFQDTMVLTTHFLKRCVKIPRVKIKGQTQTENMDNSRILEQLEKMKVNPFKRGAMRFEDYNYGMYNDYILIDSQKGQQLQKQGYGKISKYNSMVGSELRLTEQQLEESVSAQYEFEDIVVGATSGGQLKDDDMNDEQLRIKQGTSNQKNAATLETPPEDTQPGDGDDSQGDDDENDEDEDEDEFTIFYERDEIQSTRAQQQQDAFDDIRQVKAELMLTNAKGHPSDGNRIKIQDYMPKEISKEHIGGRRKGGAKSYKSSHTGDQQDERQLQMDEVDHVLDQGLTPSMEQNIINLDQEDGDDSLRQHLAGQNQLMKEIKELIQKDKDSNGSILTTERNMNGFEDSQKINLMGGGKKQGQKSPSIKETPSSPNKNSPKNKSKHSGSDVTPTAGGNNDKESKKRKSSNKSRNKQEDGGDANKDDKSNKESSKSKKSKKSR